MEKNFLNWKKKGTKANIRRILRNIFSHRCFIILLTKLKGDKMLGKIKAFKDATLSKAAKVIANNLIQEYGEVLDIQIDTSVKSLSLTVMLKGEVEALTIEVNRYLLEMGDGELFVTLYDIHTSREWIDIVAKMFIEGRKFTVAVDNLPDMVVNTINKLI